jgi:gas vesicle protein
MSEHEEKNAMLYLLAGVGLGAIIGLAAGMLFAPKSGAETREDIARKFKDLKSKTEEWIAEQKAKRHSKAVAEEIGA